MQFGLVLLTSVKMSSSQPDDPAPTAPRISMRSVAGPPRTHPEIALISGSLAGEPAA